MRKLFADFETYWSATHSLTKMPPTEYVLHPDTEIQSVSIRLDDGPTEVIFGEQRIGEALRDLKLSDKWVIGHNMAGFDSLIIAWRYGLRPKLWGCTQAMARPSLAKVCQLSLASLAEQLGVGKKLSLEATNTKGKRLSEFSEQELEAMRTYNGIDTDLCAGIFAKLLPGFTATELLMIDFTVRMRTEPALMLDTELLRATLAEVQEARRSALLQLAHDLDLPGFMAGTENELIEWVRANLSSNDKFANLLRSRGVEPPMKVSAKKSLRAGHEVLVPAFAKNDEAFIELVEHEDPVVSAAVSARLGVKSTQLQTRIERFLRTAQATGGPMPIPLHYAGAATGRWSGADGLNAQNMPRVDPKNPKPSDALRMSLTAPPGKVVIVADQSAIELRVNHFLWQVPSTMALYQEDAGADLYRAYAAHRLEIELEEVQKAQRQLAKVMQLGLGFGAGGETFRRVARTMGGLTLTPDEALEAVQDWRADYPEIVRGWRTCSDALDHVLSGRERAVDPWGLVHTSRRGMHLPSGRIIEYPELRREQSKNPASGRTEISWVYGRGRFQEFLTGPKVDENIVQALARDTLAEVTVRFYRETGIRLALTVHDELVYVVESRAMHAMLGTLQSAMRKPPSWWPQLITWSEGDSATRYGLAK